MSSTPTPVADDRFEAILAEFEQELLSGVPINDLRDRAIEQLGRDGYELLATLETLRQIAAPVPETRVARTESTSDRDVDTPFAAPNSLGRFRILKRVASGGNGVVFHAFDPQLSREVALKVPRLDVWLADQAQARFLTEARAAAQFDHPNVVPIFEVGQYGAVHFIVSGYCRGPSLSVWLRELAERGDSLPPEVAAKWVSQVAAAVEYAHQRHVVHRDLKPSNILLETESGKADSQTEYDDPRFRFIPRITDFGIAKIMESEEDLTSTGTILGTPHYMAPEQVDPRIGEVGPKSDIYALGIILYEMLSGFPPIQGETEVETLSRIGTTEPAPIRVIRSDVSADLEAICLQCLEKDPAKRYETAAELAADLNRFLSGEPVLARKLSSVQRIWKRYRQRAVRITAAISFLLILVALVATMTLTWSEQRQQQSARPDQGQVRTEPGSSESQIAVPWSGNSEAEYFRDIILAASIWEDSSRSLLNGSNVTRNMEQLLEAYIPEDGQSDLRGFEWHYLWHLAHPGLDGTTFEETATLRGHEGTVFSVEFAPTGNQIASAGADRTARIWDAVSGQTIHVLRGHSDDVNKVRFSPDGRLLATASDDHTAKIYDLENNAEELQTLSGHEAWVTAITFSPDGNRFASGDNSGVLKTWDAQTWTLIQSRRIHDDRIMSMIHSPDGQLIATASDDGTVKLWDSKSLELRQQHSYYADRSKPGALAFSHSGKFLAVGGDHKSVTDPEVIVIYDIEQGQPLFTLGQHTARIHSVRFSEDDLTLISIAEDGNVLLWDLATHTVLKPVEALRAPGWSLSYSADGTRLATTGEDGAIRVWNCSGGIHRTTIPVPKPDVSQVELSPDGSTLAVVSFGSDGKLRGHLGLWDVASNSPRLCWERTDLEVLSACFSADGQTIAVGSSTSSPSGPTHRRITLLDALSGEQRDQSREIDGIPIHLTYTDRDESLVALVSPESRPRYAALTWNLSKDDYRSSPIKVPEFGSPRASDTEKQKAASSFTILSQIA